jgi:hypothetical protein
MQAATIEEWLLLNEKNVITCPYHSGDLKITQSSCRNRRRKALEWNYGTAADNLFLYGCEQNLRVCLECDRIPLDRAEPSLAMDVLTWGGKSCSALPKGRRSKEKKNGKAGDRPSDFSPVSPRGMKGAGLGLSGGQAGT